jgi:PAS domain S-box-containing protein
MPDGMVLMDTDGRIIAVNPSATEIFHDTRVGMVGKTIDSFLPADVAGHIRKKFIAESRIREYDVTLSHEVPSVVSIAGSVVMDENEDPAGSVLIIRDITERKASENALRVANEKLSKLSQLTRHDISNLVTALYGYLTLLEDEYTGGEKSENLTISLDIVDSIIDHLRFSREYEEIGSKDPVWQSLGSLLTRAAESLPHAGVRVQIPETPVEVYADPLSEKVFYNLLENALRHGETG